MEDIAITHNENTFHIEGFPDAVKVLKITGPKSRRLADLALHKADLDFSLVCLETINSTPSEPYLLREVLCQAALIRFISASVRANLASASILKSFTRTISEP